MIEDEKPAANSFINCGLLASSAQNTVMNGDVVIHIVGKAQNDDKKLLIDIYKRSGSIKIVYAVLDSIKITQMELDTAFTGNKSSFMKYVDSLGKMSQQSQEGLQKN
ncbi:hypothetical protein [Mucilaginibacter antarcticus]|uniref:hypothetical protein n=1 Tax=Mucilaginibacter antarcticus TaxID=1855725 RepID=UPI0036361F78